MSHSNPDLLDVVVLFSNNFFELLPKSRVGFVNGAVLITKQRIARLLVSPPVAFNFCLESGTLECKLSFAEFGVSSDLRELR
jgi:hypothetical protein